MNKIAYIIFFVFLSFVPFSNLNSQKPSFVWKDQLGYGRQQKVLFRNTFDIKTIPDTAFIHLFGSSRYHLFVNGVHLNFGPSRFYPQNPQYDSYNLSPFLKKGKNCVSVEVLANGMETYQIFESIGSFIAWGDIITEPNKKHSLETPGKWKMLPVNSLDTNMLKFSFAAGPVEVFDSRLEPENWRYPDFDDSSWRKPITISKNYWGNFKTRTIPKLTQNEVTPLTCLGIYEASENEKMVSFYFKTPDENQLAYNKGVPMAGITYIYSPVEQTVELGSWWGEYYLNGLGPIEISSRDSKNPVRENRVFKFNKGWNQLFVKYTVIWGAWEFILAMPENANLEFSASKIHGSTDFFKISNNLSVNEINNLTKQITALDKKMDKSLNSKKWISISNENTIKNPARNLVWNLPDINKNNKINDFQTTDFSIEKPQFLVFDMGRKILGRMFFEIDAPEGSQIDIGWSEDLNDSNLPWLYKRLQINSGARFITSKNRFRYETFKPYGVRYILVKVSPSEPSKTKLSKIGVIEQVYPYEKLGSFECSDPMFTKIWELGWRTLRVCSEDSYIDTPFRERGLYAGDAVPEYAITLATSGDSRLMKKSLLLFQDMYHDELINGSQNKHNDFILKTLVELFWYYKYTGDTTFVKELYPNYQSYINHLEKQKTAEGYYRNGMVFLEWTKLQKTADLTGYQALLYGCFKMMENMSTDFGFTDDQNQYHLKASSLKEVIKTNFWDTDKQTFFDGFHNGKKINNYYPISAFYPLLFDVVDNSQQIELLLNFLDQELLDIGEESRNRKITPYGAFYLFQALYQNEQAGLAERFMKQYWSRMILQGDDTSWENFDIGAGGDNGQGTASHAWSGHPTYFLSTEVLGVQLGFNSSFSRDTIFIEPQSENLSWAKGVVPHPLGYIGVSWQIIGNNLLFEVMLPKNTLYVIQPKGRLADFKLITTVKTY